VEAGRETCLPIVRRDARPARLLLQVCQLLFCGINRFLLGCDLILVLLIFLVPRGSIAQPISCIGVHRGGAKPILTLHYIEFTGGEVHCLFLVCNSFFPSVITLLPIVRRLAWSYVELGFRRINLVGIASGRIFRLICGG
jgi:hypothetical protein